MRITPQMRYLFQAAANEVHYRNEPVLRDWLREVAKKEEVPDGVILTAVYALEGVIQGPVTKQGIQRLKGELQRVPKKPETQAVQGS